MEDIRSVASKSNDEEIKGLERKLARLKATRKSQNSSSTDSEPCVVKMRRSESDEELKQFAAQLPYPHGVVDKAVSGVSGDQGMAGWRAAHSLSDSARPETPSADGGR
eukprot:1112879-Amphidinium_carterae.1